MLQFTYARQFINNNPYMFKNEKQRNIAKYHKRNDIVSVGFKTT